MVQYNVKVEFVLRKRKTNTAPQLAVHTSGEVMHRTFNFGAKIVGICTN